MALIVEAGWTSYDILNPNPAAGFGGIVDAGPVEDYLTEGTVKYFLDGRFYVTQFQGGLRALYQKCPHLGCKVGDCTTAGASGRLPVPVSRQHVQRDRRVPRRPGAARHGPLPDLDRERARHGRHVVGRRGTGARGPHRVRREPPTSCGSDG